MSRAPKIPAPEWERHKDHIHDVYVVQSKTLEELISFMAKEHGFEPTKAQYVRKLDRWNMRKNFKQEEWEHANTLVRERKLAGKDTELVMSGRVIKGKKRRKGLNRYAVPLTFFQATSTDFDTGHDRIVARTPPSARDSPFIIYDNLPWFQFQDHVTKLAISNMPSGILIPISVGPATSLAKVIFGISVEQDGEDAISLNNLCNVLEGTIPKRQDEKFNRHIERLSQPQPLLQVLQWVVFLSSNALLPNEKADELLRWVIEGGHRPVIEHILQMRGPTATTFASNLLLSAIRVDDLALVKMLLEQGISPNTVDSTFTGRTALQTAVISANSGIIQLLLDRGADVNGTIPGPFENLPPLNLFLKHQSRPLQIVKMLIKAGADVHYITTGYFPALQAAVLHRDPDVVTVLLEAGADVNAPLGEKYKEICTQAWEKCTILGSITSVSTLCTPLCLAASYGNEEIVRRFLEAGADIDGVWFGEATADKDSDVFDSVNPTGAWLGTPLQISVRWGHLAVVKLLLDAGANPNAVSFFGSTALQSIFGGGVPKSMRQEVAHLLLRRGAIVNIPASRNLSGMTPVQKAAEWGDVGVVSLFLDNGADLNAAPYHRGGRTALQAAAESMNTHLVILLIEKGGHINANAAAYNGLTCLQAAASTGNLALVNILLQLGANANAPASPGSGKTALQFAVEQDDVGMVKSLLDAGADVNQIGNGETILCSAIKNCPYYSYDNDGHKSIYNLLMENGVDVNAPASPGSGRTALQVAVEQGDIRMVKSLIDAGADVDQINNGQTVLCSAIKNCHYDGYSSDDTDDTDSNDDTDSSGNNESVFNLLMENGADPDPSDAETTPLAVAACNGKFHLVVRLLDAGANVNRPSLNPLGISNMDPGLAAPRTPLAIAVAHAREEVVTFLINSGANLNHAGLDDGANPLHYAFSNDKFSRGITESLLRGSADPNRPSATGMFPIHLAATFLSSGDAEAAIKMLIDAGADVNSQPGTVTALQRAVEKGHKSLVEMLLDVGAEINAPAAPSFGTTALQAAAKRDDLQLVRDLISRGADVNAPAAIECGATALQLAAINGNINMAILLLENGADINAEPAVTGGRTTLQGAAEHGRLDMVYLLLENDNEIESFQERCQDAARFADSNHHPILAKVLQEWQRP